MRIGIVSSGPILVGAVSFTSRTGACSALTAGRGTGAPDIACGSLSRFHVMRTIPLAGTVYRGGRFDDRRETSGC